MAGGAGRASALPVPLARSVNPASSVTMTDSVVTDSILPKESIMRTAAELRAEAAHLRTHPCNAMSFHAVNNRACNVWKLPKPVGDYAADYVAGCRVALELIDANQRAVREGQANHAALLVMHLIDRLTHHHQRMGFLDVIAEALACAPSADCLARRMDEGWSRVFSSGISLGDAASPGRWLQ